MGDVCDTNDIERFLRSQKGQAHLEEIRKMLLGRTITDVTFSNEVHVIATTLHFDDGENFVLFQPSLEVEAIREQFEDVLEQEYYEDYPERKPEGDETMDKNYNVGVREVHVRMYSVKAPDEERAKELVRQRGVGVVDTGQEEYSHELGSDTWSVEEAKHGDKQAEHTANQET